MKRFHSFLLAIALLIAAAIALSQASASDSDGILGDLGWLLDPQDPRMQAYNEYQFRLDGNWTANQEFSAVLPDDTLISTGGSYWSSWNRLVVDDQIYGGAFSNCWWVDRFVPLCGLDDPLATAGPCNWAPGTPLADKLATTPAYMFARVAQCPRYPATDCSEECYDDYEDAIEDDPTDCAQCVHPMNIATAQDVIFVETEIGAEAGAFLVGPTTQLNIPIAAGQGPPFDDIINDQVFKGFFPVVLPNGALILVPIYVEHIDLLGADYRDYLANFILAAAGRPITHATADRYSSNRAPEFPSPVKEAAAAFYDPLSTEWFDYEYDPINLPGVTVPVTRVPGFYSSTARRSVGGGDDAPQSVQDSPGVLTINEHIAQSLQSYGFATSVDDLQAHYLNEVNTGQRRRRRTVDRPLGVPLETL